MTVETTKITSGPYAGNGVTAQFPYDFRVDDAEELQVFETDTDGAVTLLSLGADYTVDGVGVDQGGLITRAAGPLPSGYIWYIRRSTPRTQPTDLNSQGGFFPDVHEAALDRLTFIVQELEDRAERALRLPDSYPGDASVEIQGIKPLHYFRWSADGKRIEFARDVSPFDQNLNTGDVPEFEGLTVTGATKAGGTYRVQYLTGGTSKADLVYQVGEGLVAPAVGDTIEVSAYSPASPKCPAVWECTAVDAELPAGAVPGDVTGAAEGRLYVANPGGGYFRFEIAKTSTAIDVRHFGASGAGVAGAIRAAISYAGASLAGAVIFGRSEVYDLDGDTISLPDNVTVDLNGSVILDGIFDVADTTGVTIQHGTIDFSSASTAESAVIGITGDRSVGLTLRGLKFNKTRMRCQRPEDLTVEGCAFIGTGVFITAAMSSGGIRTAYRGNFFTGWSSQIACNASGADNIGTMITGNTFYDTGDTSIFCRAFNGCVQANAVISNNILIHPGKGGITAYIPQSNTNAKVQNVLIANNVIIGVGAEVNTSAISVFDGEHASGTNLLENIVVVGNVIDGRRQDGIPTLANVRGIRFDGVVGGVCSGNVVQYTSGTGINVDRGSDSVIANNTVKYSNQNFTNPNNENWGGISIYEQHRSAIESNVVSNCGSGQPGMHLERVRNCTISGVFSNNESYGIQISGDGAPPVETDYNVYHDMQLFGNALGPIDPGAGDLNSVQSSIFDDDGTRHKGGAARRSAIQAGLGSGKSGYMYFNTDTGVPNYWNGSGWVLADGSPA